MFRNINLLFFIIPAALSGKSCGNCSNLEQKQYRRCLKSAIKSQHNCIKKCNIFKTFILCTETCIDGFKRKIEGCPCIKGKKFISNSIEADFDFEQSENKEVTKIPDLIDDTLREDCWDRTVFCDIPSLAKYCDAPKFQDLCCQSCAEINKQKASSTVETKQIARENQNCKDQSAFCTVMYLKEYCKQPEFRELCCRTCADFPYDYNTSDYNTNDYNTSDYDTYDYNTSNRG